MQIELTTDTNVIADAELRALVVARAEHVLARFAPSLTRVVVRLTDANGDKGGSDDIRCAVEARPERRKPVGASHAAGSIPAALDGALAKLARALGKARDKAVDHSRTPPMNEVTSA
jgi:ribosome-associated translation inhibitor RaiA